MAMNNQKSAKRIEIYGALISIIVLWIIIIYMGIEAYNRLRHPNPIDTKLMLFTAILGVICNFISIFVLKSHSHSHSHHHDHHHQHHNHAHSEKSHH